MPTEKINLDELTEYVNEEIKLQMREDKKFAAKTLAYIMHHHKIDSWAKLLAFL